MSTGGIARSVLPVISSFLIADLEISTAQFGVSVTVMVGMVAIGVPLFGVMADRVGARRVLVIRAAGAGMALMGIAASDSYAHLVVWQVVLGFVVAGGVPASNRVIAETVPISFRGLAMGVKQSGATVGVLLAGATIPAISVAAGWRTGMVVAAAASIVTIPAILLLIPTTTTATRHLASARMSWTEIVSNRSTRWLSAHGFLSGIGIAMVFAFIPLYAVEAVGLSPTTAGQVLASMSVVAIGSRIAWGRIGDVSGDVGRDLRLISLLSVVAVVLLASAGSVGAWSLWAGAAIAGMSMEAWNSLAGSGIISAVPVTKAGRASSLVQVAFMAGNAVGPALFGATVDASGSFTVGWVVCASVFVVASMMRYRPPHPGGSPVVEGPEVVERIEDR